MTRFNGHPPLGVNATPRTISDREMPLLRFNGHPPLGVNATASIVYLICTARLGFNGHPPLGVNATFFEYEGEYDPRSCMFQRAPTLGGECYAGSQVASSSSGSVSMGTHPWG